MSKSKLLYIEDMTTKEFKAKIISINDDKYIILDQTAFYPKSGGVDCDTGIFYIISDKEEFNVVFTGKLKGEI